MNRIIPSYLIQKGNIIKFLIFTAVFSMVFINIYQPFGSGYWIAFTQTQFFLISGAIVIAGIGILTLSRLIMHKTSKKHPITYWLYFVWIIIEIGIIALIYSFITKFVFKVDEDFIILFTSAFLYTTLILFFPYTATWLYFALRDAEKVIQQMTHEENFIDLTPQRDELIHFKDEKGELRISIALSNMLYIESADNYVELFYLNKGKISHFLLRNSLKILEEQYANRSLVRCHRSYIINIDKVKILRKDKDSIYLEMDMNGTPDIPVSKSYTEKIIQIISRMQN